MLSDEMEQLRVDLRERPQQRSTHTVEAFWPVLLMQLVHLSVHCDSLERLSITLFCLFIYKFLQFLFTNLITACIITAALKAYICVHLKEHMAC